MKLIRYDELKPWQKDNSFILTGYRGELKSYWRCFQSLAYFHNESVNINTHLFGSLLAISSLFYLTTMSTAIDVDTLMFGIFFISAATCLGFSAAFHTFNAHSHEVSKKYNQLDYIGIACLIWGTFVSLVNSSWKCDPLLQYFYWALITVAALGAISRTISTHGQPQLRRQRTYWFIALGCAAIFPLSHMLIRDGYQATSDAFSLNYLALGGFLYILGALLYAERCPERFEPGLFDYVGASHQIFHVFILLAAYSHYCAIKGSYGFRMTEAGSCGL